MPEKERRERTKRATMGFQVLEVITSESGAFRKYQQICGDQFKSLTEAERHIRKNADSFNGKLIVIAHLKKELKVSTETKSVAKLEEVK